MVKGFLKVTNSNLSNSMPNMANTANNTVNAVKLALLGVLAVGLTACGQKGALVLPSDQATDDNKAVYLIQPKKANGEPQPTPQTDFSDQPSTTPNIKLRESADK